MKKIAIKISTALLATGYLFVLPAQAQVYKWVDSKGVTHYDDKPPPESSKSKEVQLRNPTGANAAPAPAAAGGKTDPAKGEAATGTPGKGDGKGDGKGEAAKADAGKGAPGKGDAAKNDTAKGDAAKSGNTLQEQERAFRQRQAAREQQEAAQKSANARRDADCKKMYDQLADVRRTPVLYDLNDKGERVYMSDKQRDDFIATQQKEYDQNCK